MSCQASPPMTAGPSCEMPVCYREHNLIVFADMAFFALPVLCSRHIVRTVESEADACVKLGIRRAEIPCAS